jgi:aquaporin rerated protein, invertebrate
MGGVQRIKFGVNELSSKTNSIWRAILAEFIGTYIDQQSGLVPTKLKFPPSAGIFILNFFSVLACTHAKGDETLISLAFGLSVFMAVMV